MGKHKKYVKHHSTKKKIPKNRDIEDIVYQDAEKNEQKENNIEKIKEQKQEFKEQIKVETTGQFKGRAQRMYERILAEDADEKRQIDYLKVVQKLQEENEL